LLLLLAVATLSLSFGAGAQTDGLQLPISLDADSTDYDGKSSMLMFRGLRLSQGNIGVVADEGRATQLDFEDSVWHFSGNVVIDVENGHMESDAADLQFSGYQLRMATISGSPATFEITRQGSDENTYAEAGKLVYDFDAGVVEFSDDATISEGGNKIASDRLLYDIRAQRINASSGDDVDSRVRITYTPDDATDESGDESSDNGSSNEDTPPREQDNGGEDVVE